MNERKNGGSTSIGKSDENDKPRRKLDLTHRFVVSAFNLNEKGRNMSKPCDGTVELDPVSIKGQKRALKSEEELDGLPASGSHRTFDSNNHLQGSYSRKSNFEGLKIESHYTRPLSTIRTKRSNPIVNKNSCTTRSDESLNIDNSPKFYERDTFNNTKDFHANSKKAYGNRKYEESARNFPNYKPFNNKILELSWSDESLNQNFTHKNELHQKSELNNSKNIPGKKSPLVKPWGKINGLPISMTNSSYDKKQQKFSIEEKLHSSKNLNSEASKSHYGKRDFNHIIKVDYESAINPPFNADNGFSIDSTICPIPPPHDVDTFLTIAKDDDADSISSENLEPMENYDLPASDKKQDKLEDSENSDVSTDPAVIKSVANYLEKLEKEELKNLPDPNKVVREVNSILNYKCKGNQVRLYGSHLSGLALELSNINLVLKSNQPEKNSVLLMLQRHLSKGLNYYEVEPFEEETSVRKSKICFYTRSSVQCVIMYDMKPVSDYCKTSLLLKRVHEFDPRVKTLIIAARKWVEAMNENGNNVVLHPVGLALLVVYFLQHTKPAVLPIIDTSAEDLGFKSLDVKNDSGVGELWFKFLQFYTKIFDWETDVVTIQHKEVLLKSDVNWEHFGVAIQEPYSRKNVTESFSSYEFIHLCFKVYYEHLLLGINSSDSETDENSSDCPDVRKYSFFDTRIKCPLPVFCEECAELEDEFCEKCQNEKSVVSRVLEKLPELTDHSMKCIDKALLHVYNTVSLTGPEMKGRQAFVEYLEEYIQIRFPGAQLKLFGSSVNMFGLKKSDLDISMTLKHRIKDNIAAKHFLQRIVSHLRKRPREYSSVLKLFGAKVPIVKFYAMKGGFLCDLSLYNVLSVHNSKLLSKYAMIDERCRIIGCALKYLTMKGWISDSSSKFLSSYSYVLMVIHYLQQTNPPVLPVMSLEDKEVFINNIDIPDRVTTNENYWYYETPEELRKRYKVFPRNESSTAELWVGFFEYYLKFDRSFAVTITQKEPMPGSELAKKAKLFNIEDPFEYKRNLGGVLSEENADKTLAVFLKARSLFGRNVPTKTHENVHNHYFSTNNLLGRVGKEMECNFCGAFDHDSENCLKKNPFKKSAIRNSHPATRPGRRRH